MKLYYSPGACSLSPHIVLHETGLPHESVLASTKTHKLQDGTDFYTLNPKGYVPLLELDNGERISEGPVIVQYLADQAPASGLIPAAGTMPRYRVLEWMNFTGTELHKNFSPLFTPGMNDDAKNLFRAKLVERFTWVDGQLAGKTYLGGDGFSVADAYLFTVSNWATVVGVEIGHLTQLAAYRARVSQRPAVQAAMKAEGLIK